MTIKQENLADTKVSARQQYVHESPYSEKIKDVLFPFDG